MFLTRHMQNAYVTHDLDKAMEIIGNRFDVQHFDRFDPDMTVMTPDGPRPMVIVHKKNVTPSGNNPTLLYGYGGFNVSITPEFSVSVSCSVALSALVASRAAVARGDTQRE